MEIRYTLTEDDYIKFNLYHIQHSKTGIRTLRWQRFLPPFIYIGIFSIMPNILDTSLPVMLSMALLMSILWVTFYPKYFNRAIVKNVKKMLREGDNNGLLGDQSMILEDEGLVVSSKFNETKVSWSGIKTIKEDENSFYLYVGAINAYVIPKRQLENPAALRTYFSAKITNHV